MNLRLPRLPRLTDPGWVVAFYTFFPLFGRYLETWWPDIPDSYYLVAVPLPLVVLAVARRPRALALSWECWLWLAFVFVAWRSLGWTRNATYGELKLLVFLATTVIPGISLFVLCRAHRAPISWGPFWLLGVASLVDMMGGFSAAALTGHVRWALGEENPIWVGRRVLLLASVAAWLLPSSPWLMLGTMGLCFMVALATGSRGPLVSLFVANGLLALGVLLNRHTAPRTLVKTAQYMVYGVLVMGLLLTGADLSKQTALGRATSWTSAGQMSSDEDVLGRVNAGRSALQQWSESPIIGHGLGGFRAVGSITYPHNAILEVGCELGLVGVVLWLAAVVLPLLQRPVPVMETVLYLQVVFYAMTSGDLAHNPGIVIFGLLLAASRRARGESTQAVAQPAPAATPVRLTPPGVPEKAPREADEA